MTPQDVKLLIYNDLATKEPFVNQRFETEQPPVFSTAL